MLELNFQKINDKVLYSCGYTYVFLKHAIYTYADSVAISWCILHIWLFRVFISGSLSLNIPFSYWLWASHWSLSDRSIARRTFNGPALVKSLIAEATAPNGSSSFNIFFSLVRDREKERSQLTGPSLTIHLFIIYWTLL